MLRRLPGICRRFLSRMTPNVTAGNYVCVVPLFVRHHKRLPRNPWRADAAFYDFFFHRMIRNTWTPLEIAAVDKEYAKIIAKGLSSSVQTPQTIDVVGMPKGYGVEELRALCAKYVGKSVVIKPTHNSGGILFLQGGMPTEQALQKTLAGARRNFFYNMRETQYIGLEPKLIVEEDISVDGVAPVDYKFFCSRGKVFYCQVDTSRFSDHRREMFSMPEFKLLDVEYGHLRPEKVSGKPKKLKEMEAIAAAISKPFDFVRVDLYEREKDILFGEVTFTPCASMDTFSDKALAVKMLDEFKSAMRMARG